MWTIFIDNSKYKNILPKRLLNKKKIEIKKINFKKWGMNKNLMYICDNKHFPHPLPPFIPMTYSKAQMIIEKNNLTNKEIEEAEKLARTTSMAYLEALEHIASIKNLIFSSNLSEKEVEIAKNFSKINNTCFYSALKIIIDFKESPLLKLSSVDLGKQNESK